MCGISGIFFPDRREIDPAVGTRMMDRIAHRGPDHCGVHREPGLLLAHARLSVIDLSASGHQPMRVEAEHLTLAYNGEVYNYRELRQELAGLGHRFTSDSDTEVVLRAWVQWGPAAPARFNGMFALALWDARAETLHLVRDRFGIKPLYVAERDGTLAFGSTIAAVVEGLPAGDTLSIEGLGEYMWFGTALGERTLHAGVAKLLPGHRLSFSANARSLERYATLDAPPVADSFRVATTVVAARLEESVRRQLVADVPVGVFLSGGIDSSAITAFATRHAPGRLSTYSMGFGQAGPRDELPQARRVAAHFGTDHHEVHVAADDLPGTIEDLVRQHGEPFGDAADIPLYLLARRIRSEVTVVLQGDGGDELFGGYRRYKLLRALPLLRPLATAYMAAAAHGAPARLHRTTRMMRALAARDAAERMALLLTEESPLAPPTRVLAAGLRAQLHATDPFAAYRRAAAAHSTGDAAGLMLRTDMDIILPDIFLRKVDTATMAHALESRVPFLDNDLAGYAMGLPARYKASPFGGKRVLKAALRGVVPDFVLDSPKKGFGVPFGRWLRGPLHEYLRAVVSDPAVDRAGVFDRAQLDSVIAEHVAGTRNHGLLLWKCLLLSIWLQQRA